MAEFYDHPETGVMHFRAPAGGWGGGGTSMFDAPARPEDIKAHPNAHAAYLRGKQKAAQDQAAADERLAVIHQVEDTVEAVKHAVSGETKVE